MYMDYAWISGVTWRSGVLGLNSGVAAYRKEVRVFGLRGNAETGWRIYVEEHRVVHKGLKMAAKSRPPR